MSRLSLPILVFVLTMFTNAALRSSALGANEKSPPEVGDKAPDFQLRSWDDREVALGELTKSGPVVLVVLRGYPGYQCPLCSRQVGEFSGQSQKFAELKANIVFVYPGPGQELKSRAKEFLGDRKLGENFHLVIDPDYAFTSDYRLRWDAVNETAYPATFVIDASGKIQYAKISLTHGGRAGVKDILQALQAP